MLNSFESGRGGVLRAEGGGASARPAPLISRRDQSRFHVSGIGLKQGAYLLSKRKETGFVFSREPVDLSSW